MSSLRHPRSPVQSSGLDRLSLWLAGEGYPSEAISRILIYTHREGTPTGAPDLDREDEEMAEHAFVEGQEPIQDGMGDNRAWLDPGVYNSVGADYTLDRLGWSLEQMQAALADTDEMPDPGLIHLPSDEEEETFPPNAGERKPGGPRVKIPVRKLPRI